LVALNSVKDSHFYRTLQVRVGFFAGGHTHLICFVAITHKNMVKGINDKHIYEI
jgi:hypothetical protein